MSILSIERRTFGAKDPRYGKITNMNDRAKQLALARAAKSKAVVIFRRFGRLRGVGITKRGGVYALKVNFEVTPERSDELPTEVDGVPVVVETVGDIRKQ